jgi:hypothetical protein
MICYICHRDAVGQCKDCGRFYCPDHGDIHCVKCRSGSRPPGKQDVMVISDLSEPTKAGPACSVCQGTAAGACRLCGMFYCSKHGNKEHSERLRGICDSCLEKVKRRGKYALLFMAVWIMIIGLVVGSVTCERHHQREVMVVPEPVHSDPAFQNMPGGPIPAVPEPLR